MAKTAIMPNAVTRLLESTFITRATIVGITTSAFTKEREYESVTQMIGAMSQKHCAEPAAFERANYMKMLDSYRPLN